MSPVAQGEGAYPLGAELQRSESLRGPLTLASLDRNPSSFWHSNATEAMGFTPLKPSYGLVLVAIITELRSSSSDSQESHGAFII